MLTLPRREDERNRDVQQKAIALIHFCFVCHFLPFPRRFVEPALV